MEIEEFEGTPYAGQFPDAFQRYLGLQSLDDIVNASNANGATRLLTCAPFEPIEALTLTFFDTEVHASHVVSDEDAWERIASEGPSVSGSPFAARQRTFEISDLPNVMQGWRTIADAVERAVSCMSDNPDEISFYHLASGSDVRPMRVWFNPTEQANPDQRSLLDGYTWISDQL